MIKIRTENTVKLSKAGNKFPSRPHPSTMWRWYMKGIRGVRLETFLCGGQRYTSTEAIERFIEGTTAAADGKPPPDRTSSQREKAIAQAEQELKDAGI